MIVAYAIPVPAILKPSWIPPWFLTHQVTANIAHAVANTASIKNTFFQHTLSWTYILIALKQIQALVKEKWPSQFLGNFGAVSRLLSGMGWILDEVPQSCPWYWWACVCRKGVVL